MPEPLLQTLQYELRLVLLITSRDTIKRLASICLILFICLQAGSAPSLVYGIAAGIMLTEVTIRLCHDTLPERDGDIGLPLILLVWLNNIVSTFLYLAPALLLAGQPSVPLMLTGFVWIFGAFVHITNTFIALPYYNWSLMIPSGAAIACLMWVARDQGFARGPEWEWLIATAVMLVYASNTIQTLAMQKDTQRALSTARAEANARLAALERMTQLDGLTGLLNRRAFDERLEALLRDRNPGSEIAVFIIDLDGFKPINDSYSHEAGDHVLVSIGHRLARVVEADGIAARLGGDEFAVALPGIRHARQAVARAQDIATEIDAPIHYEGRTLRISASIGVGLSGSAGGTVAALCAAADQAMYRAKADASNRVALFDARTFAPRITLQDRARLSDAMHKSELRPHYQPKVCLHSGRLRGFEALARWEHPVQGLLLPEHFLPMIGDLGLQGDFLNHIARQVLGDVTALLAEGLDPGQVSINVPEVTLATYSGRKDLDRLLDTYPRATPHITFEITEDVFIARAGDFIQHTISHFRGRGVRISLDDFGTGFASFQHLRELEFDELKIDQSFVAGLGWDHSAEVLVGGFLAIAKGLGVDVIAEGVETDDQRSRLLQLGAELGQGWRFGQALPLNEARIRILTERSARAAS